MTQNVQERVSTIIKKAPFGAKNLSEKLGVSKKTIYRWRDKEVENFKPEKLKALAKTLDIRYEWLAFGKGPKVKNKKLNQIDKAVNEKGESYKGLDQTLSNVESKANNLKQDLQDLIDEIEKLRGGFDD